MSIVVKDPDYAEPEEVRAERLIESLCTVVTDAKGIVIPREEALWLGAYIREMQETLEDYRMRAYDG